MFKGSHVDSSWGDEYTERLSRHPSRPKGFPFMMYLYKFLDQKAGIRKPTSNNSGVVIETEASKMEKVNNPDHQVSHKNNRSLDHMTQDK